MEKTINTILTLEQLELIRSAIETECNAYEQARKQWEEEGSKIPAQLCAEKIQKLEELLGTIVRDINYKYFA